MPIKNHNGRRSRRTVIIASIVLALAGCATLESMEKFQTEGGVVQNYDVPYQTAFELAENACKVLDFNIESKDYDKKVLVAENEVSGGSWGERIGFYFTVLRPEETQVRVVSRRKIKTTLLAAQWANEVHLAMQRRLEYLRKKKVLP